jgi:hypothetical protein
MSAMLAQAGTAFAETTAKAGNYRPPRALDGKPSLEGNWTNASITSLQRAPRYKNLVIPNDQVEAETNANPQVVRQRNDDGLDANTKLNGSDLKGGRGYNAFWIDPGMTFARVKGEYRTSQIVFPENGQIPYLDGLRARGETNFDGPEGRPLGERCIINSGSAGPPMTTYLYNNNYEIVQTPDAVAIRAEMNNYARIIRIGGKHVPAGVRPLHGDSIGQWQGDTLVVETTNFSPQHASGFIPLTEQARVTERLTRYSDQQILYEFTVEDPTRYKQPWRGEMSFNATKDHVYEYACHEGNYALHGTLSGAREQEKRGIVPAAKADEE